MQLKLEEKQDAAHKIWVVQDRATRKRLHRKLQEMAATLPPKHLREARRSEVAVAKDADTVPQTTRPATAAIVDEAAGLVATTPGAWPEPASPVKESTELSGSNISSAPDQHAPALQPIIMPSGPSRIVDSIFRGFGWIKQSFGRTHIGPTTTHEPTVPANELPGLVFSPTSRRIHIHSTSNATKTAQRIVKQGDRHHPYLGSPRNGRQRDVGPEPGSPRASNESLTENMSSLFVGLPEYGPMPPPRFNNINEFFDRDEDDMLLKKSDYNLTVPEHMRAKLANQKAERAAKAELARQKELEREREARREELRQLRVPKSDLIPKISPEWQRKAEASIKTHQEFKVVGGGGTTVTSHDFQQLVPSNVWLNDNIIQASLALTAQDINARAGITKTSQTPKCVTASSYFYNSFSEGRVRNPARGFKKEWGLTGANFKDVDTILMPINRNSHWTMLVIRPTARTIAYVDSFHSPGREHIEVARKFIKAMVGDAAYDAKEWKIVNHEVPLQTNGWDCGVFAVTNGICLALGLDPNCYDARDMPLQRKRIAAIIMNHGFTGEFSLNNL
ncbi:sentrin-specific protease 1 [Microdochium nivale]|nr:sentrin-specific protease 1 [Microdochium nivale]